MNEGTAVTLVDTLLAEQQSLTAVERFSQRHDRDALEGLGGRYSALLPVAPPGPGEQYAFEVNLDACTGCKACVVACHSLNGLDDDEAWRDVGLLLGGKRGDAYQQTVTSACHHCEDPACMNGCPVGAYEKEADTGVVRHLDDQCIGCGYCVLKCPYDVPKYNERLGIVRKCDMCVGRLREGEAPACVQACPTSAISIRVVKVGGMGVSPVASKTGILPVFGTEGILPSGAAEGRMPYALETGKMPVLLGLVPGAFDSSYTRPTTVYRTTKIMPQNTRPADAGLLRLEHAHWPLIAMLVLSQMSVGMFVVLALMGSHSSSIYVAAAALQMGLGASVLHLGRPLGAWRFFLGLRKSWMSREILAFSVFAGMAMGLVTLPMVVALPPAIEHGALVATALIGLLAVFTSAMIYIDTRRPFWKASLTHGKFFGTAAVLGTSAVAALMMNRGMVIAALSVRVLLFAWERTKYRKALDDEASDWHLSARVMKHRLAGVMDGQEALFLASLVVAVPVMVASGMGAVMAAWGLFIIALISQVLERYCFFVAAMGMRMTGGYKA